MANLDDESLRQLLAFGQESAGVEFKASIPWPGNQSKLTRTLIAMANREDGGVLIIGRSDHGARDGITPEDLATYKLDAISAFVNTYADPYVILSLRTVSWNEREYVAIGVAEFREVPVICRRDSGDGQLRRGALYVRSLRMPETTVVQTAEDMREVLSLAVDKGVRRFIAQAARGGIDIGDVALRQASERFRRQIEDMDR